MRGERPEVGQFIDRFAGGLPGAVAGPFVDPQDPRPVAEAGGLERRDIFEAVGGHDPVVGIGCRDQDRRIGRARADRVIGRIGQEVAEIGLLCRIAVIPDPELSAREAGEAQHVHDADAGKGRSEQVRPLVSDCRNQQPAIGFALDREAVRRGDAFAFQIFGGGDEIVEDVLLVREPPGIVPRSAVFPAATQIGNGVGAAPTQARTAGE